MKPWRTSVQSQAMELESDSYILVQVNSIFQDLSGTNRYSYTHSIKAELNGNFDSLAYSLKSLGAEALPMSVESRHQISQLHACTSPEL